MLKIACRRNHPRDRHDTLNKRTRSANRDEKAFHVDWTWHFRIDGRALYSLAQLSDYLRSDRMYVWQAFISKFHFFYSLDPIDITIYPDNPSFWKCSIFLRPCVGLCKVFGWKVDGERCRTCRDWPRQGLARDDQCRKTRIMATRRAQRPPVRN